MKSVAVLIAPMCAQRWFFSELLSCPVVEHIQDRLSALDIADVCYAGALPDGAPLALPALDAPDTDAAVAQFLAQTAAAHVLILYLPTPCLSPKTLTELLLQGAEQVVMLRDRTQMLGLFGSKEAVAAAIAQKTKLEDLPAVTTREAEGVAVCSAETLYIAQEQLRRTINLALLAEGVMLLDPAGAHISPRANIAPGTVVLPGCQIYGKTVIGEGCRIGPNTLLQDATLGAGVKVNASQIYDSTVGDGTTVGPFSYIRPGCDIGSHVKIGDFVELKKTRLGDGTKVSHLTYLGDAELGRDINVGCGVVTVNYDGKNKHRTQVGDGSFIGCNVNLVAPVTVGAGAYVAAGTTVVEPVPDDALSIGRCRQENKPDWAKKRRDSGKW